MELVPALEAKGCLSETRGSCFLLKSQLLLKSKTIHSIYMEHLARTCVLVAVDGVIHGAFAVSDPLKPEVGHVVSFLNSMSISSIMVTGDNWATATAITKEVGINKVFAKTDPVGKANKIRDLQAKGLTMAMVGDGINDSPALVATDVGMAIGLALTWF